MPSWPHLQMENPREARVNHEPSLLLREVDESSSGSRAPSRRSARRVPRRTEDELSVFDAVPLLPVLFVVVVWIAYRLSRPDKVP